MSGVVILQLVTPVVLQPTTPEGGRIGGIPPARDVNGDIDSMDFSVDS